MSKLLTIAIDTLSCGNCGVYFGMESGQLAKVQADGSWFYCPNGHRIHYFETANQRLEKERDAERQRRRNAEATLTHTRDQLDAERRSKAAYRGHLTRVKRRIANGVCPCCSRSFDNVRRHMASQHPGWLDELEAKASETAVRPDEAVDRG